MAKYKLISNYNTFHYGSPRKAVELKMEIINYDKYKAIIDRMNKIPKKEASRGVKAGATLLLKQTKSNAPKKTGTLRRSMKVVRERFKRYTTWYQVTYAKKYNSLLQKKSKAQALGMRSPKVNVRSKKQGNKANAYYPASLEYGYEHFYYGNYLTYRHGRHFMRDTAERNSVAVKKQIQNVVYDEIKKRWEGKR